MLYTHVADLPSLPLLVEDLPLFRVFEKTFAIPLCFENFPLFSDFPGDRSATRSENKIGTKNETKFRSILGADTLCKTTAGESEH